MHGWILGKKVMKHLKVTSLLDEPVNFDDKESDWLMDIGWYASGCKKRLNGDQLMRLL